METICQENNPQHGKIGKDTPLTMKRILTERPSLNNRRRQLFGSTNKSMKEFLNDGDTTNGDTLYKYVFNIDLLKKL